MRLHQHVMSLKAEHVGKKLDAVRHVLQHSRSSWSQSYWTQVESQLLRQFKLIKMELE